MRFSLLTLIPIALVAPSAFANGNGKPIFWILTGTSVITDNFGWGGAFLNRTVAKGSSGENLGQSGATTVTFRQNQWANVLQAIKDHKDHYEVWTTIEFGYNDQKEKYKISLNQFSKNLGRFVDEIVAAGAHPMLITPMSRRVFEQVRGQTRPYVKEDLKHESEATIAVAKAKHCHYIDFNKASTDYLNSIGQENADKYNHVSEKKKGEDDKPDRTHLNKQGAIVFSRMVADLILRSDLDTFNAYVRRNEYLTNKIHKGEFVRIR